VVDIYNENDKKTLLDKKKGNLEMFKQGIKAGANPATKMAGRHNCLRLAIQRAYFHIVRYLVEERGMSLSDDKLVFHYAALGNLKHPTMLAYLKERGGDINHCDEKLGTPLMLGMFKGDVDELFARWLIQQGADVTTHAATGERSTALHKASEFGSLDLIKLILERGGDSLFDKKDIKNNTPLLIAAEHGREDVVELFLGRYKVDPNQYVHYTPLFLATQNGHYGVCKLLVDAGANVDIVDDEHKCTPLHLAASNNHLAIMKLLLENGAEADRPDKRGFTPLLMAATEDYFDAVRLLVKHGANPSFVGPDQVTPLHLVASRGQGRMCALLLQLGANPGAIDVTGKTPLEVCEPDVREKVRSAFENYKDVVTPASDVVAGGAAAAPQTDAERAAAAESQKKSGVIAFKDLDYNGASRHFLEAIALLAGCATAGDGDKQVTELRLSLLLNLSMCWLKLEKWTKAIETCTDALKIDAQNGKALFRRASAYEQLGDSDKALADAKAATPVDDPAIQALVKRAEAKIAKRTAK
jgi:ankyrin repeat protein